MRYRCIICDMGGSSGHHSSDEEDRKKSPVFYKCHREGCEGTMWPEPMVREIQTTSEELVRVKREVTRLNEAYANLKRAANGQITELQSDVTRYRQKLADLGCCPSCLQVGEMDEEGPHSHCRCGTSEDYARRPLQSYQMLVRSARELITSVINNHGKVPIAEWSNFVEKVSKSEANHD